MKKLIITVFLITVGWLSAIAGDEIKLTEGSLSSLKDGGVGCVVIDIKDTTFDNKMPLRRMIGSEKSTTIFPSVPKSLFENSMIIPRNSQ